MLSNKSNKLKAALIFVWLLLSVGLAVIFPIHYQKLSDDVRFFTPKIIWLSVFFYWLLYSKKITANQKSRIVFYVILFIWLVFFILCNLYHNYLLVALASFIFSALFFLSGLILKWYL